MNATEVGVNPYRPAAGSANLGASPMAEAMTPVPTGPYDERAKGFDGDMLDAICKGRWQEGMDRGLREGREVASRRFPNIFDEGFAAGHNYGYSGTRAQMASEIFPILRRTLEAFEAIAGLTGSEKVKFICGEAMGMTQDGIEAIAGVQKDDLDSSQ